jgi:hypothetical protein
VGHSYEADHRAGAGDVERRLHRLAGADALQGGVDAHAAGHLLDGLDGGVAALGDDVGGAELRCELLAVGVARRRDDPLGAEALGGEHAGEADGAVADDGDGLAGLDLGADGGVVVGGHDVREGQQRAHHLVGVAGAGHRHERAVGERDADRLALAAVAVHREEAAVHASGRVMPFWQCGHVPSVNATGAMTRSPFDRLVTSTPMSSTTPTNSWPIGPGSNSESPR